MGLKKIALGEKVPNMTIDRYNGANGVSDILGILTAEIQTAYIHYHDSIGYIYANDASIEKLGPPGTKYILPTVHYRRNNADDITDYGLPIEVKRLMLGNKNYTKLMSVDQILKAENSSLTKVDLLVTCLEENFQDLDFQKLPGEAKWRTDEVIKAALKEPWKRYRSLIESSVAREMSNDEFLKAYDPSKENGNGISQGSQQNTLPEATNDLSLLEETTGDSPSAITEGSTEEETAKDEDDLSFDDLINTT